MADRKPSRRANQFWQRMAQSWGANALAEAYGTKPPEDWCRVVDRCSNEQIAAALAIMRQKSPVWLPKLGEFEAALPRQSALRDQQSIPDILAVAARDQFPLCGHQLACTWNYFGKEVDVPGQPRPELVTTGVSIPPCTDPDCLKSGRPGFRLLYRDVA